MVRRIRFYSLLLLQPPQVVCAVGVACSVDATREDPALGFGRLLNHSRAKANLVPHKITVDGVPHIVMIAARDIEAGEELLYDYGERDTKTVQAYPWLADGEPAGDAADDAAKRARKTTNRLSL